MFYVGSFEGGSDYGIKSNSTTNATTVNFTFVATGTTTYIHVIERSDGTLIYDNVSVREIDPLAVSIQMQGRMTYADTEQVVQSDGTGGEVEFLRWRPDSTNYIHLALGTFSTRTGEVNFVQEVGNIRDVVTSSFTAYSPGVNVPFNIASRHGSTFVNGAVDGVALTANTTPTALPDLSATDLQLGYDYMGTISLFRIWANDIGDAGIVEATEPSTEPTLSLTFDGTATSFTDFEWSE